MIHQEVIELNTQKWLAKRSTEIARKLAEQTAKDAAAYEAWKLENGIPVVGSISRQEYVLLFDPCMQGGL